MNSWKSIGVGGAAPPLCLRRFLVTLQSLYGAHELRMVNPRTFPETQRFLVNLRGKLNIFLSLLRLHFLSRDVEAQHDFMNSIIYYMDNIS